MGSEQSTLKTTQVDFLEAAKIDDYLLARRIVENDMKKFNESLQKTEGITPKEIQTKINTRLYQIINQSKVPFHEGEIAQELAAREATMSGTERKHYVMSGFTALHYFCMKLNKQAVDWLLSPPQNAVLTCRSQTGVSPLHCAVSDPADGSIRPCRSTKGRIGEEADSVAVVGSLIRAFKTRLDKKYPDPSSSSSSATAAASSSPSLSRTTTTTIASMTPEEITKKRESMLRLFIDAEARGQVRAPGPNGTEIVQMKGFTSLEIAAMQDKAGVVVALIRAGASIRDLDSFIPAVPFRSQPIRDLLIRTKSMLASKKLSTIQVEIPGTTIDGDDEDDGEENNNNNPDDSNALRREHSITRNYFDDMKDHPLTRALGELKQMGSRHPQIIKDLTVKILRLHRRMKDLVNKIDFEEEYLPAENNDTNNNDNNNTSTSSSSRQLGSMKNVLKHYRMLYAFILRYLCYFSKTDEGGKVLAFDPLFIDSFISMMEFMESEDDVRHVAAILVNVTVVGSENEGVKHILKNNIFNDTSVADPSAGSKRAERHFSAKSIAVLNNMKTASSLKNGFIKMIKIAEESQSLHIICRALLNFFAFIGKKPRSGSSATTTTPESSKSTSDSATKFDEEAALGNFTVQLFAGPNCTEKLFLNTLLSMMDKASLYATQESFDGFMIALTSFANSQETREMFASIEILDKLTAFVLRASTLYRGPTLLDSLKVGEFFRLAFQLLSTSEKIIKLWTSESFRDFIVRCLKQSSEQQKQGRMIGTLRALNWIFETVFCILKFPADAMGNRHLVKNTNKEAQTVFGVATVRDAMLGLENSWSAVSLSRCFDGMLKVMNGLVIGKSADREGTKNPLLEIRILFSSAEMISFIMKFFDLQCEKMNPTVTSNLLRLLCTLCANQKNSFPKIHLANHPDFLRSFAKLVTHERITNSDTAFWYFVLITGLASIHHPQQRNDKESNKLLQGDGAEDDDDDDADDHHESSNHDSLDAYLGTAGGSSSSSPAASRHSERDIIGILSPLVKSEVATVLFTTKSLVPLFVSSIKDPVSRESLASTALGAMCSLISHDDINFGNCLLPTNRDHVKKQRREFEQSAGARGASPTKFREKPLKEILFTSAEFCDAIVKMLPKIQDPTCAHRICQLIAKLAGQHRNDALRLVGGKDEIQYRAAEKARSEQAVKHFIDAIRRQDAADKAKTYTASKGGDELSGASFQTGVQNITLRILKGLQSGAESPLGKAFSSSSSITTLDIIPGAKLFVESLKWLCLFSNSFMEATNAPASTDGKKVICGDIVYLKELYNCDVVFHDTILSKLSSSKRKDGSSDAVKNNRQYEEDRKLIVETRFILENCCKNIRQNCATFSSELQNSIKNLPTEMHKMYIEKWKDNNLPSLEKMKKESRRKANNSNRHRDPSKMMNDDDDDANSDFDFDFSGGSSSGHLLVQESSLFSMGGDDDDLQAEDTVVVLPGAKAFGF